MLISYWTVVMLIICQVINPFAHRQTHQYTNTHHVNRIRSFFVFIYRWVHRLFEIIQIVLNYSRLFGVTLDHTDCTKLFRLSPIIHYKLTIQSRVLYLVIWVIFYVIFSKNSDWLIRLVIALSLKGSFKQSMRKDQWFQLNWVKFPENEQQLSNNLNCIGIFFNIINFI